MSRANNKKSHQFHLQYPLIKFIQFISTYQYINHTIIQQQYIFLIQPMLPFHFCSCHLNLYPSLLKYQKQERIATVLIWKDLGTGSQLQQNSESKTKNKWSFSLSLKRHECSSRWSNRNQVKAKESAEYFSEIECKDGPTLCWTKRPAWWNCTWQIQDSSYAL